MSVRYLVPSLSHSRPRGTSRYKVRHYGRYVLVSVVIKFNRPVLDPITFLKTGKGLHFYLYNFYERVPTVCHRIP